MCLPKIHKRDLFKLFLILPLHFLFIYFLSRHLVGIYVSSHQFFISSFLGKELYVTKVLVYISDFLNLFLIFVLGEYFFADERPFLPLLLYSFNPWSVYQTALVSPYIFFLFIILLFIFGLILLKENRRLSFAVLILASFFGVSASLFFFFILPLFWFLFYFLVKDKKMIIVSKKFLMFSLILLFFLVLITYLVDKEAVFSSFRNEAGMFSDPGFINMVNTYRGESVNEGFGFLSKMVENKYFLGSEFIFLKLLQNLTPATFFTAQEKMFGFSFSPPVFLGFLIPFAWGLYKSFLSRKIYLLAGFLLLLPSLLSINLINIDRLILFFPIIIYLTSYGFNSLSNLAKPRSRLFIFLSLFLVIFQFLLTVWDISIKEKERFIRYYGAVQEINIR